MPATLPPMFAIAVMVPSLSPRLTAMSPVA
jgi:hypothetical protein